ncbi:MAG: TlpA family protein disulfide reductase [Alphaproteobacteria bacterium]|nr:MAG: TlpA family protein disulfide reductase [Alphaproteobacteria bacterium]
MLKTMRLLILAAALLGAACSDGGAVGQGPMQKWVGTNIADLSVQTLDGGVQPLKELAGGKPVVLNVWATWCSPCLREMPTLDALGRAGEFEVVAIATDKDTARVKDYLRKQGWGAGMHMWFDSLGAVTRKQLGAVAIPVTYVLDPSLTIVMVEAGERDWMHDKMLGRMRKAVGKQ